MLPQDRPRPDAVPPRKAAHRRAVIAAGVALSSLERTTTKAMSLAMGAALGLADGHGDAFAAAMVVAAQAKAIARARAVARTRSGIAFHQQTGLDAAPVTRADVAVDAGRAKKAAASLGRQFSDHVDAVRTERAAYRSAGRELTAEEVKRFAPKRSPLLEAREELAPSLERTASTEVPSAWNQEWRRQSRYHAERGITLIHEWNAEADACDRCHPLHGETVRDDERFSEGDPPLHPHCHCRLDTYVEQ